MYTTSAEVCDLFCGDKNHGQARYKGLLGHLPPRADAVRSTVYGLHLISHNFELFMDSLIALCTLVHHELGLDLLLLST